MAHTDPQSIADSTKIINRRLRNKTLIHLGPGTIWLVLFFIIPCLMVLLGSFDRFTDGLIESDFTLDNYKRIFSETLYGKVWLKSIGNGIIVTALCLVIGYPVGHYLARLHGLKRNLMFLALVIPFWTTIVVRTYAWKILLGSNGFLNYTLENLGIIDAPLRLLYSWPTVIVGLAHVYLPFIILPIYASLEKFDFSLEEAAFDLGATRIQSFVRVLFPLSLPGVMAGTLLVFIMSVGAFLTPDLLGGPGDAMISNIIQTEFFETYNWPFGSALVVVLMVFSLVFLTWYMNVQKKIN